MYVKTIKASLHVVPFLTFGLLISFFPQCWHLLVILLFYPLSTFLHVLVFLIRASNSFDKFVQNTQVYALQALVNIDAIPMAMSFLKRRYLKLMISLKTQRTLFSLKL